MKLAGTAKTLRFQMHGKYNKDNIHNPTQRMGPKALCILPSPCAVRCRLSDGYPATTAAYIVIIFFCVVIPPRFSSSQCTHSRSSHYYNVQYSRASRKAFIRESPTKHCAGKLLVPTMVGALPIHPPRSIF